MTKIQNTKCEYDHKYKEMTIKTLFKENFYA